METQLAIVRMRVDALKQDPQNARKHPKKNLAAIRASLERFGQRAPLLVRQDGTVVAGNGTLSQLREMGVEHADVVVFDGSDEEARALAIAMNRTADLAEWDDEGLAAALASLSGELQTAAGFIGSDLVRATRSLGFGDDGNDVPEVDEARCVSRIGDLWLLGAQRILCGDSMKTEDVQRLMCGEKAVLLATDPPYLVDYRGGNHPHSWVNKPDVKDKDWDDYNDPTSGLEFFVGWLAAWLPECILEVPIYQWHATRRQVLVERAWEKHDILCHQTIVWVKARPVITHSHYMWQSEPCFYGWRKGHMPVRPPANESNVWQINQQGEQDGIHPTQKPVEIFERPIMFHTVADAIVAEPFSGSGTQIIAAEKHGRRCRAMEISPAFVDVAVRRWEQFTGKQAILDGDGRTFAEVAAERLAVAEHV